MIFVTSDLHFHHENIIRLCNRPFRDVDQMHKTIIGNWNRVVQPQDEVYVLGDFSLKGATFVPDLLAQLHGTKYLIRGNHDRFARFDSCDGFVWMKDYYELQSENQWFILCHYPFAEWNHMFRGSYHLHGHIHSQPQYNQENKEANRRIYDVGQDANGFAPVPLSQIVAWFG